MCADDSPSRQRTKDQQVSGNLVGRRRPARKEDDGFFDGLSPMSVRQGRSSLHVRDVSERSSREEISVSPRNSSMYSRDGDERNSLRLRNDSKEGRLPRSRGGRSSSLLYKYSSAVNRNPDSQHSVKGDPISRDAMSGVRSGTQGANNISSNSSLQSGKFSNPPSSGASSINGTPSARKKCSGKGNRKLHAKVFALSMELIEHVSKGRLELAETKIKQGASPNYADYDKRTPLHLAASEGHLDLVKLLLDYGANPDVEDRWRSKPYDDAVKHGFKDTADVLRKYCEPDDEDTLGKEHHDGLELLEYSARGFERLVREKIRAGTKTTFADYDRRTALHLAASEGHAKIVGVLLNNGADATFKDRFGHTAVDDAMRNGFLEVLAVMDKKGVEIPEHIFDKSHTPAFRRNMRLIDVCARGKVGMAHKLLQEGADAKFGDYDRRTPLHLACAEGHLTIVRMLISAGGDISAEDRWGSTPFEEAMKYEHTNVVKFLEESATASPVTSLA